MSNEIPENIAQLKKLLPILQSKEAQGLIRPSYETALSLVKWVEDGRVLTEKQNSLVGRLILRANRKHRKVDLTIGLDVDAVVSKVLEKIGDQKTDVETIIKLIEPRVMKAIEARAPRKIEITVEKETGKKTKLKGPQHREFEHLLRAATGKMPDGYAPNIFLQGEASSGKTTGARMLAEALDLDWHFNGAISFPHDMLGFIDGAGKYHRTPFREAYERGGVYTFDEVDRSDPVALLAVNPHLAGNVATFPDKQIKKHKDCIIVCTANTWGLGADVNYSGATKLDAAFLSRFPVRIGWDIDPDLESAIVDDENWLNRVRRAREAARAAGLKVLIDTRVAQAGAMLIRRGYTPDEAAARTYLANLRPEQRAQVGG